MNPDDLFAFFTSPETFAAMLADAPLLVLVGMVYVRPWMRRVEDALARAKDERADLREQLERLKPRADAYRDDPTPRFGVVRGGNGGGES
jgi:hypothetical protein